MASTKAKRKPTKKAKPAEDPLFAALRAILEPYAKSFKVSSRRGFYSLDDQSVRGWLLDFAAVVAKRNTVSFYVMSTHHTPSLLDDLSPALLAKRTKSGGFFNFKALDEGLFGELRTLVERAYASWDAKALAK